MVTQVTSGPKLAPAVENFQETGYCVVGEPVNQLGTHRHI